MTQAVPAPAVELTIRVRYPMPTLDEDYSELGIHTIEDLVDEEVQAFRLDPEYLVEMIESDRSEATIEYTIDSAEHPFAGGDQLDLFGDDQ